MEGGPEMKVSEEKEEEGGPEMKVSEEKEEEGGPVLPMEVMVYGILIRMDAQSILQYRSVHPRWRSLIDHPFFADLHYPKSHRRLLITFFDPKLQQQLLYSAPTCGGQSLRHPITLPSSSNPQGFHLSASAAGLVCLYDHDSAYVCNPSTLHTLALPPSTLQIETARLGSDNRTYAIGYESQAGLYKVVRVRDCKFFDKSRGLWEDPQFLEVLTLGSGWRTLQLRDGWCIKTWGHEPIGFPVNGAIHYRASRRIENDEYAILAFALKSEEFHIIPVPPQVSERTMAFHRSSLLEIGGKLGLRDHGRSTLYIWMDEEELWRSTEEPNGYGCVRLSWDAADRYELEEGVKIATIQLKDEREIIIKKPTPYLDLSQVMLSREDATYCYLTYVHYMETFFSLTPNTFHPTLPPP